MRERESNNVASWRKRRVLLINVGDAILARVVAAAGCRGERELEMMNWGRDAMRCDVMQQARRIGDDDCCRPGASHPEKVELSLSPLSPSITVTAAATTTTLPFTLASTGFTVDRNRCSASPMQPADMHLASNCLQTERLSASQRKGAVQSMEIKVLQIARCYFPSVVSRTCVNRARVT